ncbi:AAA family ATPase [uncultured Fusobacterium sp.]|uniref:AAA family ATPase n=1 Tax=uncultured Fusobacterium sp. TaxID=159267 RepID=UPI0025E818FD|nr:AAA family ATPase [uncultured Fusobacterium sp.]
MKKIPIGVEDFKDLITDNYYYIDKTKLIEDIENDGSKVKLFCRPRRFGKTLNMSTIKYFFNIEKSEENRELFNGLYIEKSPYIEEQGKYPVIFISMKGITSSTWSGAVKSIGEKIFELYNEYDGKINNILTENENKIFNRFAGKESEEEELKTSLSFLTKLLYKYYNKKVVVLIDEYDSPIMTAYEKGYYIEMKDFLKAFYGNVLKTNEYLQMGVLTGIIRVAQAGIFSDLNNFISYTTLNNDYSQSFGLTEKEVENMLKYYQIEYEMSDVKKWYDGYSFGKDEIYNPWSILNFVKNRELKTYWINTSSNFMIRELLQKSGEEGLSTLEKIFNQEEVAVRITDNVRLGNNLSVSEVWELMLYSGYLTVKEKLSDGRYSVRIPNMEIMKFFKDEFLTIVFGEYRVVDELRDALYDKNLRQLDRSIERLILSVMSFHDINKKYENSYHMLLAGFFYALDGYYITKSNVEAGYGRADILLIPKDKNKAGYILELKKADSSNLEKKVEEALKQIDDKKYYVELERYGIKDIVKIGYVFDGKKVESSYNF